MCLAYPGVVKKINGETVIVSYPSHQKKVFKGGEDIKIGDRVLVQMGIIIRVISEWCEIAP